MPTDPVTDPASPICPACGRRLDPVDESPGGPTWPQHKADGDPSPHGCRASFRPLAICPPAPEPAGQVCEWPSPPMRVALALARMHYARPGCEVGGELHIVLDDDNTEAHHVEWCRDGAIETGDQFATTLANLLLCLTEGQRGWVAGHVYGNEYPELGASAFGGWTPDTVSDPHGAAAVADYLDLAGLAP